MYWYHDHGMSVTRLNVYAGLTGIWLVRDPIEHHLGLPVDEEQEIPLVLSDRNFDTADGTLILSPAERADLLIDFGLLDDRIHHVVVWNSAPAPWGGGALSRDVGDPDPDGFLVTPHVMRFDLSCGHCHSGLRGQPIAAMPLDPDFRRVSTDHHDLPANHGHTIIALLEEPVIVRDDNGVPQKNADGTVITHPMLYLHEMVPQPMAELHGCNLYEQLVDAVDPADPTNVLLLSARAGIKLRLPGDTNVYVSVGKRFNDSTMAMITQGSWHIWKVINLSPDTHPFHIHLTQFQALSRTLLTPDAGPLDPNATRAITLTSSADGELDCNELGWKDTFRVNPGERDNDDKVLTAEMVSAIGCFASHAGRYMYHCHILEHEDTEMMRTFIVVPPDLMAFMGTHHH